MRGEVLYRSTAAAPKIRGTDEKSNLRPIRPCDLQLPNPRANPPMPAYTRPRDPLS